MLGRAGGAAPGSDLGTARFETFLRRLFSVKGRVAPGIDPKISAGVELLTPPWQLAESALLAGWRGGQSYYEQAAVAGEHGLVMLLNPAASSTIVVVEHFYLNDIGAAYGVLFEPDTWVNETQRLVISRLDTRGPTPVGPATNLTAQVWAGTAVAGAGVPASARSGYFRQASGGIPTPFVGPWIISPSYCFKVGTDSVNTNLRVGFRWWERAIEPSELAAS